MPVFKELNPIATNSIQGIQRPAETRVLSLHSPAIEVFTDFAHEKPLMLEQNTPIDDARGMMKRTHIKLFLVINSQEQFRGVITLDDLVSEKVMMEMGHYQLRRNELTVEQVMTPKSRLRAISFNELQLGNVGDVLETMQKSGERHVLVVDTQSFSIRGIVSAHSIARMMHVPIVISERAVSFSDICKAVAV
jgi:CBS domain-containing protein